MTDEPLAPDIRALIATGRDALGPNAAAVTRLKSRVAGATAPAAAATKVVATKVLALALAASLGVAAYSWMRASADEETGAPLILTSPDFEAAPAPKVTVTKAEPLTDRLRTRPASISSKPAGLSNDAPAQQVPRNEGVSLAREIELVDRATIAFRRGEHSRALDDLRTYDAETVGTGQLAQDAAALAVEVLCVSGDQRGAAALSAFIRQWPRSAQRNHLNAVCTGDSK